MLCVFDNIRGRKREEKRHHIPEYLFSFLVVSEEERGHIESLDMYLGRSRGEKQRIHEGSATVV